MRSRLLGVSAVSVVVFRCAHWQAQAELREKRGIVEGAMRQCVGESRQRKVIMEWMKTVVSDHTFLFFFAVVGIPMIMISVTEIVKALIKHRERMAMIEHGMDPYESERKAKREKRVEAAAEMSK